MNLLAIVFAAAGLAIWALLMPRYDWPSLMLGVPAIWVAWRAFTWFATFRVSIPAARGLRSLLGIGGYLFVHVPADIVRSTVAVLVEVLSPSPRIRPAIVAVSIPQASPEALMVLAYGICLTPGEQVVEIDEDRRILYVHSMYVPDPERFRTGVVAVFDRYLRALASGRIPEEE